MCKGKNIFFFLILATTFIACSKKNFDPLYTNKPSLENIPEILLISNKELPDKERKELIINLYKEKSPIKEDYINTSNAKEKPANKLPSVIIYNKDPHANDLFSEAEQAIERALLSKSFNVLDRSKFEAKLRDLRDKTKPWYWDSWTEKLLESGEYEAVKDEYKTQFEEGTISAQQFTEVITEINKQCQADLANKERNQNEMNDIAEVVRAAQSGEDKADYLLQINEITVSKVKDQKLNLKHLPEVKKFLKDNIGLVLGKEQHMLPTYIPSTWLRASFNAKLIEIKTGSIVWIGSYEVESQNIEQLQISFDIHKYVNNGQKVNEEIDRYNEKLKQLNTKLIGIQKELNSSYEQASVKRKFVNSDEMNKYKNNLVIKINNLENNYYKGVKKLKNLINTPPKTTKTKWEYQYDIAAPIYTPNLIDKNVGEQDLIRHKRKLIKLVTKDLINTIAL